MTKTTNVYPLAGYPTVQLDNRGEQIVIRPMVPEDRDALLDFFDRIPEEDRFYLKEDVTSPAVLQQWAEHLDYRRAVPLLAIKDGTIIADGTLHLRRAGARRHIGEVRVVVDPQYRKQGVGRSILRKLIEIARDRGLEKLVFEVVADTEEAARRTAQALGFIPAAVMKDYVRSLSGWPHDLIIMELHLADSSGAEFDLF